MRKKILLLTVAVLFSTVNGFAQSDPGNFGEWYLDHANYPEALARFKKGADIGEALVHWL